MKKLLIVLLFIIPLSIFAQWGTDIYQSKLPSCMSLLRNVSAGSQELGVLVTSNGGGVIKRYGIIYSTLYTEPTFPTYYTGSTSVSYYNGELKTFYTTYNFSSQTVYTRGFVETDAGIAYGEVMGFTAPSACSSPQVALTAATNITGTTATAGGNVTNGGTSAVTGRGVCYGVNPNITISDSHTTDGTGTGAFTSSLTGLSAGVTYYYRAYAINACGTSYSELAQFTTTSSHAVPTLITNAITSITTNSAVSGGNTIYDGNSTIIEKGVCWNTTGTPTYSNSKTNEGSGTANFTSSITGLNIGTTYYVRAYARSRYDNGGFYVYATGYGQEEIFTTSQPSTIIATLSSSLDEETEDLVLVNWHISLSSPTTSYTVIPITITANNGVGTSTLNFYLGEGQSTSVQTIAYSKLSTQYTAYANFGTMPSGYSGTNTASYVIPAISTPCTLPTIAFYACSNATASSVQVSAYISSDGGCAVTSRGFDYCTDGNFTTILGSVTVGSGIGSYDTIITGLQCNTRYYFRPWVTNSVGTCYGVNCTDNIGTDCTTGTNDYPTLALKDYLATSLCGSGNFYFSFNDACVALHKYNNDGYSCGTTTLTGTTVRTLGTVGSYIYIDQTNSCDILTAYIGYFLGVNPLSGTYEVYYINNGIIQSITACP